MKIVTGNFDSEYKQMSIYDFLQDGESQEVQPSETVPQVDEAQEVEFDGLVKFNPSSDLDAKLPTEDTDKTCDDCHSKPLFSVGDTVKVRQADEVYPNQEDVESYYYLKAYQGNTLTVKIVTEDSIQSECDTILYFKEVIKI